MLLSLTILVMQLWDELQRDHSEVYILGATNRPQDLDPAIQRRFERSLLVPCPDYHSRKDVIVKLLRGVALDSDFDPDRCAHVTEGYTASDLAAVCKSAVLKNIRKDSSARSLSSGSSSSTGSGSSNSASTVGEDCIPASLFRTEVSIPYSIYRIYVALSPVKLIVRTVRCICVDGQDFEEAARTVYPTAWAADSYARYSSQDSSGSSRESSGSGSSSPYSRSSDLSPPSSDSTSDDADSSSLEGAYYPYSPYPYPPYPYYPSSSDAFSSSSSGNLREEQEQEEDLDVSDDENEQDDWQQ